MQYKMIVWRNSYGVFETDPTGRPTGRPLETFARAQDAAKRVREMNDAEPVEVVSAKKKKR